MSGGKSESKWFEILTNTREDLAAMEHALNHWRENSIRLAAALEAVASGHPRTIEALEKHQALLDGKACC